MLEWFNATLDLFAKFCNFLLNAPFYGSVTVGGILIAIAIMGTLIDFFIRRVK